jgi:rod shape-determining protein MreC
VALLDIRQRAGYLFLAVMVGHVVLISAQVSSSRGVPVLEEVTFGLFSEVQRGAWSVVSGARQVWGGYVGLRGVREENEKLRQRLADVEVQLQEQRALADRSRGLERLLELRGRTELQTTAAEVIASSVAPEFRTLTIDKGSQQGLLTDMAVIAPTGIVGRVVSPTARASKVQLLIDRNAAAGSLVERSRAQGVVTGRGDGLLRMEYVDEIAELAVGDTVVTSGIDGIFPKGFVIGRIERIDRSGGGYKEILVKPAVNFTTLEEVLVVLTPTPARELAAEGAR